ncbi:hypothetical protein [Photorhabdus noenieputensis]|uniref:hypothetical protein n=1 Tax=Photorhabdus noenieputensis TaxID=1208607 RepID=UPI001BD20197|nr:hypothetical protein [Photorhabdus noenieputensis]MCK3669834.1 hypothetical protein [Photorhabdus noenieputensis]
MKISNMATGKLLPVGQPMNTKKMFINKLKQDIGWMVVRCREWPIWAAMICLSVSTFSSPSVFADQFRNWNADAALKALGPERTVKRSDGVINYPAEGKATLDLFQIHSMRDMVPRTTSYDQEDLDKVRFQLRARGEIFKVPRLVSGSYECTIMAKTKYSKWLPDDEPSKGTAIQHLTVNLDKPYPNENLSESVQLQPEHPNNQGDWDRAHERISDLYFDVSCRGVNFSWQRNPDEKVEFNRDDNSPILSVLIDGEELMSWSKPTLPPIKDPVTVLEPPVCGLNAGDPHAVVWVADMGEVLRSLGPYPAQLPIDGFSSGYSAGFRMNITCTVSDKSSAGGVATLQFSAPQLADNNESIVVPGFDDALRIKVTPNEIGGNTKLAASNAMDRPVKFGPPTNPADVLYFTVGDTPNTYLSENKFYVELWQVKKLDPSTSGEFQATMNATLVVR